MNKIGIIGAMDEEVITLKNKMEIKEVKTIAGLEFYEGILHNRSIVVVECGIGKVNAAICTQVMIDLFHVDCIINSGVAGGLRNDASIGDIIISKDAIQHDFDVRIFGSALGSIPRMESSIFVADEKLINLALEASLVLKGKIDVFVDRIISGDQFISDRAKKEELIEEFGAGCTEMEGAAIAHVCTVNKIPFVIIRAISDKADDSATVNFSEFVIEAAENSVQMIEQMLMHLE